LPKLTRYFHLPDYQTAKKEYQETAKVPAGFMQADLDRGFVTSGLWGYSRHPNFAAEQSIWFLLYQWGCLGSSVLYNWTAVGPSFLILLFQGSTWLTELITQGKYSEYTLYQKSVGRFLPTTFRSFEAVISEPRKPKIIRTSELEKRMKKKTKRT
jgi:steroid 5-alpha reductase family enzyme